MRAGCRRETLGTRRICDSGLSRVARPGQLDLVVERLLAPVAAQQVERLVDRDAIDPAEEPVLRVVFIEPLRDLQENVCATSLASSALRSIQNAAL